MNIGEAARRTGLPAKTIRYYDEVGLIRPAGRAANGYRDYSGSDVENLRFVARARGLGFSVEECGDLLALYRDSSRASSDVKAMALSHVARIEAKISELQGMRETLLDLSRRCHGDDRPDCPILADLAGSDECASARPKR